MRPEILAFFAKVIETELGIVYAEHNYFQLQNRLEEIAKLLGVPDGEALFEKAKGGVTGQFRQLLLDIATNNETSFFRDPKIFTALETVVLPSLPAGEKLQVWSAASSTGQEALTVAMTVKEWCRKQGKALDFAITGSDISERVLARAKAAQYSQLEVQRGLPTPLLIKYFKKDGDDRWAATPELTRHTDFRKVNLKEHFTFPAKFHLVLCRNVLIYQAVPGKVEILKRILGAMAPGAFLVLGSGESLLGLSDDFEQVVCEGAVLYRRKTVAGVKAA